MLFDFGLAKELKERDLVEFPDGYNATGVTGSRRYMAPEVIQSLPYGFKADVFSFSILLWEIMALQTSFNNFGWQKHYDFVVLQGQRPAIPRTWPAALRNLLHACWAPDPRKRVTMTQVCDELQTQVIEASFLATSAASSSSGVVEKRNNVEESLHLSRRTLHLASRQVSMELE